MEFISTNSFFEKLWRAFENFFSSFYVDCSFSNPMFYSNYRRRKLHFFSKTM